MVFIEGILGVLTASAAIIAVKTVTAEYWAWRNRRDLRAKRVLDALAGPEELKKDYMSEYPRLLGQQNPRLLGPQGLLGMPYRGVPPDGITTTGSVPIYPT